MSVGSRWDYGMKHGYYGIQAAWLLWLGRVGSILLGVQPALPSVASMSSMLLRLHTLSTLWGQVEELLGWLPCLVLHQACTSIGFSWEGLQRLAAQLHLFQVDAALAAFLPARCQIQLLSTLALGPLVVLDKKSLISGNAVVESMDVDVLVHHKRQVPQQPWQQARGNPLRIYLLEPVLCTTPLASAVEWLETYGEAFYLNRRRLTPESSHWHFWLEEISVWAVVCGFEVWLTATRTRFSEGFEREGSEEG